MEIVPIKIEAGEEKAWQEVCGLSREDVCRRALFMMKRSEPIYYGASA
jgi:hypothetical protein